MQDVRSAIVNTIHRYGHCFDFGPIDEIMSCFTADAEMEFDGSGRMVGPQAIFTEMAERRRAPRYDGVQPLHLYYNTFLRGSTEDEVEAHSCWTMLLIGADGVATHSSVGEYHDVFRRVGDEWLIHRRVHHRLGGF